MTVTLESDFELTLPTGTVPPRGLAVALVATPAQLVAMAERFGVLSIAQAHARFTLTHAGKCIDAVGEISGEVTQACGISGTPVAQIIQEVVHLRFDPSASEDEEIDLADIDLEAFAAEPWDTIALTADTLELGEAFAQSLALALDPYPRASDEAIAAARAHLTPEEALEAARNPFAQALGPLDTSR